MKLDTLPNGEAQIRLPGEAGDVREMEIRLAPIADLPFSLTPPRNHQTTVQGGLFAVEVGDWSKGGTR